jgi:hypothetical protein
MILIIIIFAFISGAAFSDQIYWLTILTMFLSILSGLLLDRVINFIIQKGRNKMIEFTRTHAICVPVDKDNEPILRCLVTKNIVGTDTWKIGSPCVCSVCRLFLAFEGIFERRCSKTQSGDK